MKNLKKFTKGIFVFSLVLFSFFVIPMKDSFADTFYKNVINVRINKDGSADIENIMDFQPTKGTEYYIPIGNLGKSDIVNFRVSEFDNGQELLYESLESWDVKKSREEKAKKSGIVKTEKGYELCFGFGEYQRKNFILRYRVTDFIKLLKDSDMIYWQFVNKGLSAAPGEVKLTIFKEEGKFDETNSKIWAFGNKGKIEFSDGKIIFNSLTGLTSSNYVTVLVKLNKGEIISGESIDKDFSYYQDLAFKGSDYKKKTDNSNKNVDPLYGLIGIAVIIYVYRKFFRNKKKEKEGYGRGDFKGEYYREIPEKEWWKLSYMLYTAGFYGESSIIRAFFLKWIQEKRLLPITEERGIVFKKAALTLKINNNFNSFDSKIEEKLFSIIEKAAGFDRTLQENEFTMYLENEVRKNEFIELRDQIEELSFEYGRTNNLFRTNNTHYYPGYNEKGKEFTAKLVKYYNYLDDFTLLSEREILEIKVWKTLLIYATLYNIAEKVEKQLQKLSPEFLENVDVDLNTFHTSVLYSDIFSNKFSSKLLDSYSSSVESSSGGGGGYTSTGGGGDSFGGGDGGGTR